MSGGAARIPEGLNRCVRAPQAWSTAAALSVIISFYGVLQVQSPIIFGIDGHFHIRLAAEMWQRGIIRQLPELRYTVYNDGFRDHHFLFHVLYMPFALLPDLYMAAKVAAWVFGSLAAGCFVHLLGLLNVERRWLWLILYLSGSVGFTYRMLLARVPSLSLALLFVGLAALLTRRYRILTVTAFIYVWSYDAWPLLGVVTIAFALAWLRNRPSESMRATIAWIVGALLGVMVNPYFPENIGSYFVNFGRQLMPDIANVGMGLEMQPYSTWYYFTSQMPIFLAFGLQVVAGCATAAVDSEADPNKQPDRVALALLALIFCVLSLKGRRYVEYSVPFALIALAMWTRKQQRIRSLWADLRSGTAGLFVLALCVYNLRDVRSQTKVGDDYHCAQLAGEWMSIHIPAGNTVFTTDWDDFPLLYINAPKVRYILGLDPIYMVRRDEELYRRWYSMTHADWKGSLSQGIQTYFDARYAYVDQAHLRVAHRLEGEPGVERVFSGLGCWIFALGDAARSPRGS